MRGHRRVWIWVGLIVVWLVLGIAYSLVTPVFESPDESYHFFVVKHLVDQRTLPVQKAETRGLWEQEGSQPPLYYALGALLVGGIDMSDTESLLWRNPQANIGDPANPGNKNLYIHPPEQDFPWHGAVLAIHVLRLFSLCLGALTVGLIGAVVRLIFPSEPGLAVVVAATAAFIPQFLFISASVNNDNLMILLGTLALYGLLRLLKKGPGTPFQWLGLGVVLGLACLTKLSGLALLGLTGVVIALVAWYHRSWRGFWLMGLSVALPVLVLAGWWYGRNLVLYGEPTGLTAMWQVVGRRTDFGRDLWGEFRGLRWSFWGLFGWFSVAMPAWVYRLLDVLTLLAVTGLLLEVGRWLNNGLWRGAWISLRCREPEWGAACRPLALLLMAGWLGLVFVSLVRWTSLTEGSQGRLLFPAVGAFALFWVLGLRAWFAARVRHLAGAVLVIPLTALAMVAPWAWIAPAFARPVAVDALPQAAIPMELPFGEAIRLRGVCFDQAQVRAGEVLRVGMYWQTARSLAEEDVVVWLRLIDLDGQVIGLEDAYPGSGTFPVALWPVDSLLADRQYVRVGSDADAPLVARLDVELYHASSGERLSGLADLPIVGRVKVTPRRWPSPPRSVAAWFDVDGAQNVGLAVPSWSKTMYIGESQSLVLVWSVRSAPQSDYTVFVHLESESGQVVGYGDGAPRRGNYPTRYWEAGEVVVDERMVHIGVDAPPGLYYLRVGLYRDAGRAAAYRSGERQSSRWPDDAVDLGVVQVRSR